MGYLAQLLLRPRLGPATDGLAMDIDLDRGDGSAAFGRDKREARKTNPMDFCRRDGHHG